VEALFAAIGLLVCLGLLARLVVSAERRRRFDAAVRRSAIALRQKVRGVRKRAPPPRPSRASAAETAADADALARQAIERARRRPEDLDREGNVIRPRAFQKRKGPDEPLH
jgi:hypothetical protein